MVIQMRAVMLLKRKRMATQHYYTTFECFRQSVDGILGVGACQKANAFFGNYYKPGESMKRTKEKDFWI
ncbi:MAG: hypothetical protein J6D87_10460 [Clostridia bacterium]|nr:hypothetical protein [Clostridia bacterium]MBQ7315571.1 hypothetical protein [Clostridia bacterium]